MGAERGFDALREDEAGRARRAETAAIEPGVKLTTRDIVHSVWRGFGAAACGGAPWSHLSVNLSGTGAATPQPHLEKRHRRLMKRIQPGKLLSNQPAKIVC